MTESVSTLIPATEAYVGLGIIGTAMEGNGETIAFILMGHYDEQIKKSLCYLRESKDSIPRSPTDEDIVEHLKRMKDYFRHMLQTAIDAEDRALKQEKQVNHQKLIQELRSSNKPHPMGTVDQLAKRFNVSKSEIRRRKAENTLGELMMTESMKDA